VKPDKNFSSIVSPFNFPVQHDLFIYLCTSILISIRYSS